LVETELREPPDFAHKSLQGRIFDYYGSGKTIAVSGASISGVTAKSSTAPNTFVFIPTRQGVAIVL